MIEPSLWQTGGEASGAGGGEEVFARAYREMAFSSGWMDWQDRQSAARGRYTTVNSLNYRSGTRQFVS